MHLILGLHVLRAHGHDLGAEGEHVPFLGQGKHIFPDQFRLILADLDEVGLDGEAVVFTSVLPGQGSAVKIGDAVFFPALRPGASVYTRTHSRAGGRRCAY